MNSFASITTSSAIRFRVLLDTNVVIWAGTQPAKLSQAVSLQLESLDVVPLISPISTNELAIKSARGHLHFDRPVGEWIEWLARALGAAELALSTSHAARVELLPWFHRDPFDRLLIAQALVEDVPILSSDAVFDRYGVTRIW